MTDQTASGAEAGAATSTPDPDAERYAAAFAEEGITPADAQPAAEPAEKPAEPQAEKPPLPPEELAKRHEDVKAALREERRQRKELARQIEELRTQRAPAPQPTQQPQPQAYERPDPETDPLGYLKYVEGRIAAGDQQAEEQAERQRQTEAQSHQVQAIVTKTAEYENDFALDTPDYYDAANYLRGERAKEYTALGYSAQQAEQMVAQDALRVSAELLNQGRDPAAAFYELAKARGFRGGSPAPAPAQTETKPSDALARVKAGQAAAQTLSGSGGGSTNSDIDVGHVLTLKGAAFDSAFEKLREAAKAAERRTGY